MASSVDPDETARYEYSIYGVGTRYWINTRRPFGRTPRRDDKTATTSNKDGGQDSEVAKHKQISHGLAGVQRVGGRGLHK